MKKTLLILSAFLLLNLFSAAQTSLQLNINQKLGSSPFAMSTGAENNIRHDFEITRLQYYISEIELIHDGGIHTLIPNLWLFVDAAELTEFDLGIHNINSVESIIFHIGVEPQSNHEDLTLHDISHPLGPKSPSMHWGWSVGYRFICLEGNGGPNYNQAIELHAMGDDNYYRIELPVLANAAGGNLEINIDADYRRAVEDIALNSGVINHGLGGEPKQVLENFRDFVFTTTTSTSSVSKVSDNTTFNIYPNPTLTGNVNLVLNTNNNSTFKVIVRDVLGKEVLRQPVTKNNSKIDLNTTNTGVYFVSLYQNEELISTKKLIKE